MNSPVKKCMTGAPRLIAEEAPDDRGQVGDLQLAQEVE
jgi:hypothetical protein